MRNIIALVLLCLIYSDFSGQQTEVEVFMSPVSMETINVLNADTLLDPMDVLTSSSYDYSAFVALSDTVDVHSMSFVLKEGDVTLVSVEVEYDSEPPNGFTYERVGSSVFVGLGEFDYYEEHTLEVAIEDLSGSSTTYIYDSLE